MGARSLAASAAEAQKRKKRKLKKVISRYVRVRKTTVSFFEGGDEAQKSR